MGNLVSLTASLLAAGLMGCATQKTDNPLYSEITGTQKQEQKRENLMTLSWTLDQNGENTWNYSVFIGRKDSTNNIVSTNRLIITTIISGLEQGAQYGVGVRSYNSEGKEVPLPLNFK